MTNKPNNMDEQYKNLFSSGEDNEQNRDRQCQEESHPHIGPNKTRMDVDFQPKYLHQDTLVALLA